MSTGAKPGKPVTPFGPDAVINIGILGAGGIAAKMHLPQLDKMKNVKVAALAGRKMSRLKVLAERHGGTPVTDYNAVIEDPNIHAVIVATPHPRHVDLGVAALKAGKHVFMQKPLAPTIKEADDFVAAADASDRIVYCLPQLVHPVILTMRDLIAENKLGKVSGAHCRVSHGGPEVYYAGILQLLGEPPLKPSDKLWFFQSGEAAVGALFDMGVYAVARLVGVLGEARRVTGMTGVLAKDSEVEDSATLVIQFANGVIASAETGWCDGARTQRLALHGTSGRCENFGFENGKIGWYQQPDRNNEDITPVRVEVDSSHYKYLNPHEQFIECIRTGQQPRFETARAARHITEILLAGLESAKTGRTIDLRTRIV
jgi:predicted dehydrogenase